MAESALTTGPPDFIGVGTQRSGTTWWQRLLKDHPAIRTPRNRKKEQHVFDKFGRREMGDEDIARYHDLFPRKPGELSGEWTPRYMRDVWGPRVLARAAPDSKLLVMFRDPVERYRSGVLHSAAREPGRATTLLSTDAVDRGRYAMQLRRLYEHFDPEQVLVLQYEQCVLEPMKHYRRTLEFIEAPPDHVPEDLTRTRGTATKSRREPIWDDLRDALVRELEEDVEELRELVPDLDVALWKNFTHLAEGRRRRSEPRPAPARVARSAEREGGPPEYLGVGSGDSGCAWWHKLLLEHPSVKRPGAGRSLDFFATFCTRAMTDEDLAAYHARFRRGAEKVVGEWTSDYMHQAWTPMLLHRAAPDARLLVMLVNPVDRYAANVAEPRRRRDPDSQPSLAESLARGRYARQLRALLDHYDRERILVLQFERCVADPAGEYERTLRFLGVDDGFRPEPLRSGPVERARRKLGRGEDPAGGAPRRKRAELWPDLKVPLVKDLEPDVLELRGLVPELDLSLWAEFAHLADRARPGAGAPVAVQA